MKIANRSNFGESFCIIDVQIATNSGKRPDSSAVRKIVPFFYSRGHLDNTASLTGVCLRINRSIIKTSRILFVRHRTRSVCVCVCVCSCVFNDIHTSTLTCTFDNKSAIKSNYYFHKNMQPRHGRQQSFCTIKRYNTINHVCTHTVV